MDYRPSNASNRDAGANVSAARSMGNIVDILGEAENIVLGLKALDTSDRPNIFCPPLRIGRPILEPLDSSMEPTPLGPSAFIPKLLQRSSGPALFGGAGIPKWMTTADLQYSQPQQAPSSKQQNNMVPPAPGLHEPNSFDLSLSSLDDTPLSLDYIGDLEAGPALVCSSAVSVSPQGSSGDDEQLKKRRVRKYKEDQWNVRFEDLLKFRAEEGHVMVPHSYPKNQKLAQWVKRQRYQYRLKQDGKHSTLSDAREDILTQVGFVWDSHKATWTDHFQTLEAFAMANGHCYIPPQMAKEKSSLITWCKHQRRQYKRYQAGVDSTMTPERIRCLESIGFDWDPRNLSTKRGMM